MPFSYIDLAQAQQADGVRMIVPQGIPSPWSEAAKALLQQRNIPWQAVYLDQRNEAMTQWSGRRSAPVLFYNDQAPIHRWADIVAFAQQHGEGPDLLPADTGLQQQVMVWCQRLCDAGGLGWNRRLMGVDRGLKGEAGGYPEFIAHYLGKKYGYQAEQAAEYKPAVIATLGELSNQLRQQQAQASPFLVGDSLTVADIYLACFMAFFKPYDDSLCPMLPVIRTVFETLDEDVEAALNPILLQHRDFVYQQYLELPLQL